MHQVCQIQTLQTWCTLDSACHWLLGVIRGPAHGPRVFIGRLGGPDSFAQGSEAIELACAISIPTMKTMSRPLRHLSPPPDIALERIGQTTLGLLASRPIKTPGSNQHGSVPLTPRWSCKNQSTVRKFANYYRKVLQINTCMICILSA